MFWLIIDSLRFFRFFSLILRSFRFRFLLFRFDAKQAESGIFSLPSETKFSLQSQFSFWSKKWGRTLPLMPFMLRFRSYVDRRCKYALLKSINMYYDLKIIHFERGFKRKVAWFSPTFCLFQFAWRIFVRRPFSFCVKSSAGILEQSMGARNRVGIGFS
jgi:hypothetical protein